MAALSAVLLASIGLLAMGEQTTVTPVQKVLQMMNDMKTKGIDEKNAETATFATTLQFCKDTTAAKERAIADGEENIRKLAADIQKYDADAMTLGTEITELDASIDKTEQEKASATEERETGKADYNTKHAELSQSIDELEVGMAQLKSMMSGTNAAALIQTMTSKIATRPHLPLGSQRLLTSFLESSSTTALERAGLSAPEGAVFESQSGGIVDMMDGLKDKMEDEKTALEKEEMTAQGSFDMIAQTLTSTISEHSSARSMKAKTKKEKEAASSQAAGEKVDTATAKTEDEKYLKDVQTECAVKASDYETNQKLRAGEVGALNKAIEIIAGGAVSGAADKHLPSLAQQDQDLSFAQLRSSTTRPTQLAVASFLKTQGQRTSSRILSMLAIRASEDPFAKVKKMIQDMVYKLMEEANEEAEHKGFCDTEMGTNKMTREQKGTDVEELTASIEEMGAHINKLGEQIGALSSQVAELDAAVSEATKIRQDEKTKNTETITEAKAASTAVQQALGVLQDFYSKAAGAVLLQAPVQASAGGGVIGMLEVILSDFERLEATTKIAEETAQKEYETFTNESSQDKAVKETQIKNNSEEKTQLDVDNATAQKDLESTQSELDAALEYFEKLKPSCVEAGVSYEDRVARRKEEIESLKDALKILDDQPIA